MEETPHCREFGREFRRRRLEADMSLRKFCQVNKLDAAYVSRIERGRVKPPTSELDRYLRAIGLEPGTEDWKELRNLASACAAEVPAELMSDEEIVKKLPVVFRTLANRKPTQEDIDRLIETIRGA